MRVPRDMLPQPLARSSCLHNKKLTKMLTPTRPRLPCTECETCGKQDLLHLSCNKCASPVCGDCVSGKCGVCGANLQLAYRGEEVAGGCWEAHNRCQRQRACNAGR